MKKIFSAFLLMTMMVASVGSFVSCSDIEDAIAKVEGTATENAAQIKDLESKIAALQTALATAQADAAAAKAEANAAKQAAATAKAEAIEAALAEIAKVQDDVDAANAEIKKINDALAGYATKEAVELLENTVATYKALTDKNAEAIEAIEAELAALKEAGLTAEKFAEVVAKMEQIDKDLVNFAKAVAGQIQSIVFVPTTTANELAAMCYTTGAGTNAPATNFVIPATFEVRPAELASTLTSDNTFFTSVDVETKAAAAQVVPVKIINADSKTGRVQVIGILADKTGSNDDYNTLTTSGKTLSLALCVSDANDVTVGEETVDLGTYTSSEFVPVMAKATANIYDKIGFLAYNNYGQAVLTKTYVQATTYVPYNTPVADSKVNLFNTQVVVDFLGMLVDPATASAIIGKNLDVQYKAQSDLEVTIKNDAGTIEKDKAPIKVTGNDLTATAELVAADDYKNEKAVGVTATMKIKSGWKVNGQPLAITAESSYVIINKQADADIVVEAYSKDWTYTDGSAWAYDSAANAKDIQLNVNTPIDLTGKTFDMYTYHYHNN